MAGIMFKQLAFVVGFALLCSMGVALTLVPMLASRYLHPPDLKARRAKPSPINCFASPLDLARIEDQYKRMLQACCATAPGSCWPWR
jgi:HAE1 family hydrophobic/amphiphilic exporter-1